MNLKERFLLAYPGAQFLERDVATMEAYLHRQGWLPATARLLHLEKPGEGNMNCVLRAVTTAGSLILKQARPWVEKYPQYAAPVERIGVEAQFLRTAGGIPGIGRYLPRVRAFDKNSRLLALEDLGSGADYTFLYQKGAQIDPGELAQLVDFLSILHAWQPDPADAPFPENLQMRRDLNQVHLFYFPFQANNGLDLDAIQPGLKAAAEVYVQDAAVKGKIAALAERYVSPGPCLLQGDFYPGSWLKTPDGPRVIDPEFSFMGPPEFELGVMLAHMHLAEQGASTVETILARYRRPAGFDEGLMEAFAGVEILRRLIGVAQLPVALSLTEKVRLMDRAAGWIRRREC